MQSTLRAGVIGAGVFGGFHAAKYAQMADISLLGVYDPHPDRAQALAKMHGGRAFSTLNGLLEAVDVVSITSPAVSHAAAALAALRAGRHVYVEKPLATDPSDSSEMIKLAHDNGLTLACGFLERAVFRAMGISNIPEPPLLLEAIRQGPPSARNQDVSVVLDLMIHDLDLALMLAGAPALTVEGQGARSTGRLLDDAQAEVIFENGLVASFDCSRVASTPRRQMRLVYASGEVIVDFMAHKLLNTTGFALDPARFADDRLAASLSAFLRAVRCDTLFPLADGRAGERALDLALAVEAAVEG